MFSCYLFCFFAIVFSRSLWYMFLCHLMVIKLQKVFVGAYRRHLFWMRVVKMIKFAAFYLLVLKSNICEKIKYAQEKEIPQHFNISKHMLSRFVDFEISNHIGMFVRFSVMIDTTVLVNERYCTK